MTNNPLEHLMRLFSGLPGLGHRSARRIALHLLSHRDGLMLPLAHALLDTAENVKSCQHCGNLDMADPCHICTNPKREHTKICVVAQVSDVWAIERTGAYRGGYHVLGGVLSALNGVTPDDLRLATLQKRVQAAAESTPIEEVIIALSATVDGQSTSHYIHDLLAEGDVRLSQLAHGVPVGGELDYLDDGTITTALRQRG